MSIEEPVVEVHFDFVYGDTCYVIIPHSCYVKCEECGQDKLEGIERYVEMGTIVGRKYSEYGTMGPHREYTVSYHDREQNESITKVFPENRVFQSKAISTHVANQGGIYVTGE